MDEQKIREIVRDEMNKNQFSSGDPIVAPHFHSASDGMQIDPIDLIGFSPVQTSNAQFTDKNTGVTSYGYASNLILQPGSSTSSPQIITANADVTLPVPVLTGGNLSSVSFNGGYAVDGTMILYDRFNVGAIPTTLYIYSQGVWYGFPATTSI